MAPQQGSVLNQPIAQRVGAFRPVSAGGADRVFRDGGQFSEQTRRAPGPRFARFHEVEVHPDLRVRVRAPPSKSSRPASRALVNAPGSHPNARPAASPQRAKSAIRGCPGSSTPSPWFRAADTPSRRAPRMPGRAISQAAQNSLSVRRVSGLIGASSIRATRSSRSGRSATWPIPFKSTGFLNSRMNGSALVKSCRARYPAPVASWHRASSDQSTGSELAVAPSGCRSLQYPSRPP